MVGCPLCLPVFISQNLILRVHPRLDEVSNYNGEAIPKGNFQAYGHYSE